MSLWRDIWSHIAPSVVLILGKGAATHNQFKATLQEAGWSAGEPKSHASGWGNQTWESRDWHRNEETMLVVTSPHWSQFRLLSSDKCKEAVSEMVDTIAGRLLEA
jgi:hypothetical protein